MKRVRGSCCTDGREAQRDRTWSFVRLQWKRIGLTAVVGVFVGFAAAAGSRNVAAMHERVESSSQAAQAEAPDVARLKARNRRLEALVTVMRQRMEAQARAGGR